MHLSILGRHTDEVEELITLLTRESSHISVHIPEKWNQPLDHMSPAHLSADDDKLTRIEELVELIDPEKIKTNDIFIIAV